MCQCAQVMKSFQLKLYIYITSHCVCVSGCTCYFQPTLSCVGDRGRDSHRWVSSFLQGVSLTQGLRFLKFALPSFHPLPLRPCLFPFIGRFGLETSCVVDAAALALAAGLGIIRVPGQTAFHQRSLLCICAHLERQRKIYD